MSARIINANRHKLRFEEKYIVDTNVLIWSTYTRAGQAKRKPKDYQTDVYPALIENALEEGISLYRVETAFAEIAHVIERIEAEIYSLGLPIRRQKFFNAKSFRVEENGVPAQGCQRLLRASWEQVSKMTEAISCHIDEPHVAQCFDIIGKCRVDAYDASMIVRSKELGITNIISDDADLARVPGITLITANPKLIQRSGIR